MNLNLKLVFNKINIKNLEFQTDFIAIILTNILIQELIH